MQIDDVKETKGLIVCSFSFFFLIFHPDKMNDGDFHKGPGGPEGLSSEIFVALATFQRCGF